MATYDAGNIVYASWYANVIGEGNLQTTNANNLGDMVEAGLGFLYLASMFPRHMNHLSRDPNWMWRRIETSLTSQGSWKTRCHLSGRRTTTQGILETPEVILAIERTLRATPYVYNGALAGPKQAKSKKGPKSKSQVVAELPQVLISMDMTKVCQFCGQGQKISDCICEAGMLLRAVFRMTTETSTESNLKAVKDLCGAVEESANKRQKIRETMEGQSTGSVGTGGSCNVTYPAQGVERGGSCNVIPPPPPPSSSFEDESTTSKVASRDKVTSLCRVNKDSTRSQASTTSTSTTEI